MDIIGVIDLMAGRVVRGVGGRRSEYRPLLGELCPNALPGELAESFAARFHLNDIYLADLDAIAGAPPAIAVIEALLGRGLRLWVDAGISSPSRLEALLEIKHAGTACHRVILGLESVPNWDFLIDIARQADISRITVSLDMKNGRPLSSQSEISQRDVADLASEMIQLGFGSLILLDLAAVGEGAGPRNIELCRTLAREYPHVEIVTGGGVRNQSDLEQLHKAGCSGVLLASALHDGKITASDLIFKENLAS